jgi:Holliday junction resolvase
MAQKLESKFWKKLKEKTPDIVWTRIENWASFGTPDLLGYNKNQTYFTIELKVIKSKKLSISPATIHDLLSPKLYEGTQIFALREQGIELKAVSEEWNEVIAYLSRL